MTFREESGRGWRLILGDCIEVMATLEKVDHIITDPPYEKEAHTKSRRSLKDATQKRGARNKGEVRRIDEPLEIDFGAITPEERMRAAEFFAGLASRWVITFCQIEGVAPWRTAYEAAGLDWVRGGVWVKPNGAPQFTGDRPGQGFECLAIAHPKGRKRWNGGGKHGVWTVPLDHRAGGGRPVHHSLIVEAKWEGVDLKAELLVDTEQSPPRVTGASGTGDVSEWSMWLCGSALTELFPRDIKSTIETETSSITASRIWRRFLRSNTSDSTEAANFEMASGGSHARRVRPSTQSSITTEIQKATQFPGAGLAPSGTRLRVSNAGERAAGHPTTKPLALMIELVADFTDPGDVVLDPFAGSGTTGVAAIRLGRCFVGVEKDPRYFELACERLRAEEEGSTLQARRMGQGALFGGAL